MRIGGRWARATDEFGCHKLCGDRGGGKRMRYSHARAHGRRNRRAGDRGLAGRSCALVGDRDRRSHERRHWSDRVRNRCVSRRWRHRLSDADGWGGGGRQIWRRLLRRCRALRARCRDRRAGVRASVRSRTLLRDRDIRPGHVGFCDCIWRRHDTVGSSRDRRCHRRGVDRKRVGGQRWLRHRVHAPVGCHEVGGLRTRRCQRHRRDGLGASKRRRIAPRLYRSRQRQSGFGDRFRRHRLCRPRARGYRWRRRDAVRFLKGRRIAPRRYRRWQRRRIFRTRSGCYGLGRPNARRCRWCRRKAVHPFKRRRIALRL